MENTTESRETFAASNPTPQGQDGSSLNAAFDVDVFVHASGDGFGNTAPLRSDTGAIDMDAISQVAHVTQGAGKLTRKEKKHAKREMKRRKKEAKKAEKEAKKTYSSIKSQLKDRDKELSDKMADARKKRDSAKDVVNYIGYNKMYQDGICEVEEGMFSSSIAFDDTSYHSVRDEQQKAMFSAITRLYDQFGADTLVQMSVINTPLLKEEVGHRKFFDPERQANDAARNDAQVFNNILNDKVKEGVSNIRRNRYLTYSVTADTAEDAARQLSRIEVESSRILNSIGSKAHLMNGTQRLSVIHSLLNPYKPFLFDYQRDISAKRLQTTKDCIAPTQIDFRPDGHYNDCVKLDNGVYAQVLVMKKFGSELSDRALADMADLPIPMAITWYVQPMDKSKAINYVRTRSAWIDKEIIEEQRSAVNKGYDFSILPQELKYSKEETEDVLDHLQNKNQRLYVFTGLVYTYAESKEALDTQVLRIISTARQNSIELDTYDYRQRQGLNSILPLGHNHVEISRMFTTAQVSILVPFATQELDDAGGNYYGQNKHSRNLVVCNRKKLTSPMGFVCGKTGSGKGMFTKTEMTGTIFSNPTDEIYVIDRAGEYTAIAERYGGSTYHFGVGTGTHLNPFDTVSVEHMTRNEQIAFKVDAMLAQAGASAAEAGSNFSEVDQSLVQRCTELAFQKAAERGDNLPPTLQDFYDAANEQPEEQAQVIALRYERFVKGSMNFFNHQSNVDFNTRIVDFNLKDLPDSMLVFARLQSLAVKCGCAGKLLLHESVPYTDEMLAAVTKKTVPAFRQCMQPLVQLGLVICEDGIYAIADWEFNQNVPAIDAMREGNRVRKASERARKNGKGTRQLKKDKVLAYLTEHPEATNTEVAEKTGVSRPSVIKYRKEYAPALPAPKGGKIVKDDGTKVDTVKIDGVKVDSFDSKVDVNFDVKVDSDFDTGFYTDADGKSAGRQSARAENEAVKIASRPKNIDDRYKNTSTSTAIADGEGATGSGIPTREEVRSHFAEMGFAVDPDRFFDVNEGRGWRTNSGKPVDDWKKLAAVWDRNEHPKAATPPARTEPKANAVGKIPSVEEVMAKWGCDRETAQGYIDENMY